ncbi:unnamed protein product [Heterobilharzia americana]|nr:unnamed protein product [Heterobilharzia americana]
MGMENGKKWNGFLNLWALFSRLHFRNTRYGYDVMILIITPLFNSDSLTSTKLRKLTNPVVTGPLKKEPENVNNTAVTTNDNPEDLSKKRKNKNLIKLKKYKKRQLRKKFSRKQMNARKSLENEVKMKPITDAQEEALNYLRIWHHDYESWKFKTLQQSWLIKNALDKKCSLAQISDI